MLYLHNQINKAFVVITRHRGVRPHHKVAINLGRQVDVLSYICNAQTLNVAQKQVKFYFSKCSFYFLHA